MTADSVMHLVLETLVEFQRFLVMGIVIDACGIDVANRLIKPFLADADRSDPGKQFIEIVLAKTLRVREPLIIKSKAFDHIGMENAIRPFAESVAYRGFGTESNGDNHIKIIVKDPALNPPSRFNLNL
jgi:hypothetical protein